jgi:hypothetical protein
MKTKRNQNLLVAVIVAGVLSGCGKPAAESPPAIVLSAAVAATNPPASASAANPAFEKLPGQWLRPDGGYILDLRSVDSISGKLEAAYLNPSPIHVATAQAVRDGERVKVFIELRDVNYPGSTYTLTYDPGKDQLTGEYFQAVARETYAVFFIRKTP